MKASLIALLLKCPCTGRQAQLSLSGLCIAQLHRCAARPVMGAASSCSAHQLAAQGNIDTAGTHQVCKGGLATSHSQEDACTEQGGLRPTDQPPAIKLLNARSNPQLT